MRFIYKLRLFSYILSNLKDIFIKLSLFTIYLYIFSITLMFLSHGFHYTWEWSSPKNAFSQLYMYYQWFYENMGNLGYGIVFRVLIAFCVPHFLCKLFMRIKWKLIMQRAMTKLLKKENSQKENNQKESNQKESGKKESNRTINPNIDESLYLNKNINTKDYSHGISAEAVNNLKQLLVQDVERAIDKRLFDIFFARRHKNR